LVKSKIHAPHFLAFFQNSCRVAERIVVDISGKKKKCKKGETNRNVNLVLAGNYIPSGQ